MTRPVDGQSAGAELFERVVKRYGRDLGGLRFGVVSSADGVDPREVAHLVILLVEAGAQVRLLDPAGQLGAHDEPRIINAQSVLDAAHGTDALIVPAGWRSIAAADVHRIKVLSRQRVWIDGLEPEPSPAMTALGFEWLPRLPIDQVRAEPPPATPTLPPLRRWKTAHGLPVRGVPDDFPIPPVIGEGNDYGFLAAATGPDRAAETSVIIAGAGGAAAVGRTLEALARQAVATTRMQVIVATGAPPSADSAPRLRVQAVEGSGPAARLAAALEHATGEVVVLLAAGVTPRPDDLPRLVEWARRSARVVAFASRHPESLGELDGAGGLRESRLPFKAVDGSALAAQQSTWRAVGGLADGSSDHRSLCIEWARRAHDTGHYLVPVSADPMPGRALTTPLDDAFLADHCPLGYRAYTPGRVYAVPKVSVYIPAYNVGRYLGAAIDSVLEQDYTDVEVCVVDDGSTDETAAMLAARYDGHPRVRWLSQQNEGISGASNRAIGLCRGPYIGQLDGDDTLLPHAVRTLADYLDAHPVGYVYSSNDKVDGELGYLRPGYEWPVYSREKLMISNIAHHFRMFRRRAWLRTAGYDTTLANAIDYDMALKLAEVCTLAHVPEVLYLYRWHGKNTSIVNRGLQFRNQLRAMERALVRMGLADTWMVRPPRSGDKADGSYHRITRPTESVT